MRALYVETFYGGSHKAFADGWISRSAHDFVLETLPARHWKWRQAGSALYLSEKLPDGHGFDAMVVSGMIDLGHLKALRPDLPPALLYVHENQFDYPLSSGESRDFRYGTTDFANVACAEAAIFNSLYNRNSFLDGCFGLFDRLPDALPRSLAAKVSEKITIVPPGIDVFEIDSAGPSEAVKTPEASSEGPNRHRSDMKSISQGPPLVIWNHRHEHDKDPETSFRVLRNIAERGAAFSLAILGQSFPVEPKAFGDARDALSDRIVFDGFPPRKEYLQWLKAGDIVVSSALQENFGLSVAEAVRAGCRPVLPDRLAYPEILPQKFHRDCLWKDELEYEELLKKALSDAGSGGYGRIGELSERFGRFDWSVIATELDLRLESIARRRSGKNRSSSSTGASSP